MEKTSNLYIHLATGKMYRYFRQGKKCLCKKLLLTLYYCFIYPHINYAILICRLSRFIDLAPPYTLTEPIFVLKVSLLTVENIYIYNYTTLVLSCTGSGTHYCRSVLIRCSNSTQMYISTIHVSLVIITYL